MAEWLSGWVPEWVGGWQHGHALHATVTGCVTLVVTGWAACPSCPAVFLEILVHDSSYSVPSVPSQIWPIIRDILK